MTCHSRDCLYCGKTFSAPAKSCRRYCTRSCADCAAHERAWRDVPERRCESCGCAIPKPAVGEMLGRAKYAERRFCSCQCSADARSRTSDDIIKIPQSLRGHDKAVERAEYVAQQQGRVDGPFECPVCGMRGPGPQCAEGDCRMGVAEFESRLQAEGIDLRTYRQYQTERLNALFIELGQRIARECTA